MHVLIIPSWYPNTYNPLYGIYVKEQAEALAKYNLKIGVISIEEINLLQIMKARKLDFFSKNFIEHDVVTYAAQYPVPPKLHAIRKKIKKKNFKKIFKAYIEAHGLPDIIHVHTFIVGDLALWVKHEYNIPYVITEHFTGFARNVISANELKKAKNFFENSISNIAVSIEFQNLLEQKFDIQFNYIPNVVNTDFFTLKSSSEIDGFTFVNIAFLDKKKSQDMLVMAFYKAFKNNNKIKLVIAGNGPEYNNLKKLIQKLDMGKQISLYGNASRLEVKQLLQASDAFVLSSRYETFGVVLIEAMSCGLPVISTKSGGPESIITDNRMGMLCDIDEESLSTALRKLVKRQGEYNPIYIRQYILDNFSESIIASKLFVIYENALVSIKGEKL
jgi:glycosyltransferase involved in cell wall biosynthesis